MEEVGYQARYLVLDDALLSRDDLSLIEKLVLAYHWQVEAYEKNSDSAALYLGITNTEANVAYRHLEEMGELEDNDGE